MRRIILKKVNSTLTDKYHLLINALRVAITFIHLLKNIKCGGVSIRIYFF